MIKHHVNEEEKRDGMFAKARESEMDLDTLGQQLAARKTDLMGEEPDGESSTGQRSRSRSTNRQERGVARTARYDRTH